MWRLTLFKVSLTYLVVNSVVGYENAYDLFERRHRKQFYEPNFRNFQSSETFSNYDDRDRFWHRNQNPYPSHGIRSYFSKFGNGYDNLGNGIPVNRFRNPFRHEMTMRDVWRYEQRPVPPAAHVGFEDYTFTRRHDYPNPSYPVYRNYGNEFATRENSGIAKVDRFVEDNEDKKQKKTDEIFQKSQEGVNMDSVRKEKTGAQSHTDQSGENKSRLRSNKVVKKGHTTRGFANHHHKDETGNSTTFFDESSDFGGQSDLRDIADGFNTKKTLEHISNTGDEKFFRENGGQTANYGTGLEIGNQRFEKDFSSTGGHQQMEDSFQNSHKTENPGQRKTFQYLNGERFDYSEPHTDDYYLEFVN